MLVVWEAGRREVRISPPVERRVDSISERGAEAGRRGRGGEEVVDGGRDPIVFWVWG